MREKGGERGNRRVKEKEIEQKRPRGLN